MWSNAFLPIRIGLLGVAMCLMAGWPLGVLAQEPPVDRSPEAQKAERVELFIGLLKRRAKQILEARRPPPPPLVSYSAGSAHGYESNVDLAGDKRGDFFSEETFDVTVHPRITSWLEGEFTYDLSHTHYADLRDANLWVNALGGTIQLKPHRRVQVDLGYEYSIVNFPFDTNNSFFTQETSVYLLLAQTPWLTHKTGWAYQLRDYDTRKTRDFAGTQITEVDREDQRQTVSHELRFRFGKTAARVAGQFYRNFSNDLFDDFYDWEDYRVRGVVSRVLSPEWIGVAVASHERRNYQKRSVPIIAVGERDDLLTLAGSIIYLFNDNAQLTYSLTYRHQDSNDSRLDFIDWVNQLGVSVDF